MKDRKLTLIRQHAWASRSHLQIIRAHCVECMGGMRSEVEGCTATECALFPWRHGKGRSWGFALAAKLLEKEGRPDLAKRARAAEHNGSHSEKAAEGPVSDLEPTIPPFPIPEHGAKDSNESDSLEIEAGEEERRSPLSGSIPAPPRSTISSAIRRLL